jgi:hypothetical protein
MQTDAGGKINTHTNPGSVELSVFDGGSSRAYLTLTPDEAEQIAKGLTEAAKAAKDRLVEEAGHKAFMAELKGAANA